MNSAIIAACGIGSRINMSIPKQFYRLDGKTVLYRSVKPFCVSPLVDEIIVVTLPDYMDICWDELKGLPKIKKVVAGGETRQQSVFNGLDEVDPRCSRVVVHDGARPFVTELEISAAIGAADGCAAAVGTNVSDTIKLVSNDGTVEGALNRNELRAVQTPQVLPYKIFLAARERALKEGISLTDDVSLAELIGCPVKIVEGSPDNIKITYDRDIRLAEAILALRRE